MEETALLEQEPISLHFLTLLFSSAVTTASRKVGSLGNAVIGDVVGMAARWSFSLSLGSSRYESMPQEFPEMENECMFPGDLETGFVSQCYKDSSSESSGKFEALWNCL